MGGILTAVIPAAASIFGGIMGSNASHDASNAQAGTATNALNFQKGVYNDATNNQQPWLLGGQNALQQILGMYGLPGGNASGAQQGFQQFQQTPFYQFPLQQSQLALNRQLASSGLTGSGGALRDATQLAQGYASSGLSNYLSGLGTLSGQGQNAAGAISNAGVGAGNNVNNAANSLGNAQAAGIVGANNAINTGITNAIPGITSGISSYFNPGSNGQPGGGGGGGGGSPDGSYYIPNNLS